MKDEAPLRRAVILAWLTVALIAVFIILGAVMYGSEPGVQERVWRHIAERPGGPMTFRFVLQPVMASAVAIHDGIRDARLGRSPYFWTVLSDPRKRRGRLREGIISTARIILLALAMDVVYQFLVLHTFYPGEAVIVALMLAFLPYLLLRGPVARIARLWPSISGKPGRNKG